MEILSTRDWISLGSIDGRAEKLPGLLKPAPAGEGHVKTAEWLIRGNKSAEVTVKVSSEKAGVAKATISL